jgi:PPM family protein phosphatase
MSLSGFREGTVPPEQAEMQTTDESVIPVPPRPLTVKAFGITDRGKVRTTNEDQFLIAELRKAMRVWQTSLPEPKLQVGEEHAHLFLVADGMGGHRAGERASALAVVAIEQFTLNTFRWFFGSSDTEAQKVLAQFQSALSQADARILEESAEHPELSGMGTTVTMAFHLGAQLCVVHVGDSRAYVYRDGELHQLTQDHTVTGDMVRSGSLRPDEVAGHRLRHVITNVVGGPELGVTVEAHAFQVQAGDRLLLCSDGLTEMVTNEAIAATLDAEPAPEAAATKLLAQANSGGAPDNITLLIVRFDQADADAGNHAIHGEKGARPASGPFTVGLPEDQH